MAIYQATAIARRLKNSAGEQTFSHVRGQNIVKMKIEENNSNTPAQQRQRAVWKKQVELSELFAEVSVVGFPKRPIEQTSHNAFIQANGNVVSVSDEMEVSVAYERIRCAEGSLKVPRSMAVSWSEEDRQLNFTRKTEGNGLGKKKDDRLYAVVLEKDLEEMEIIDLHQREDDSPVAFILPEEWNVEQLAVYVFALSKDKRKASNSKYLEVKQA